jgi:hypothetical protein
MELDAAILSTASPITCTVPMPLAQNDKTTPMAAAEFTARRIKDVEVRRRLKRRSSCADRPAWGGILITVSMARRTQRKHRVGAQIPGACVVKTRALRALPAHDDYRLVDGIRNVFGDCGPGNSEGGLSMKQQEMFESADESELESVSGGCTRYCPPPSCYEPCKRVCRTYTRICVPNEVPV